MKRRLGWVVVALFLFGDLSNDVLAYAGSPEAAETAQNSDEFVPLALKYRHQLQVQIDAPLAVWALQSPPLSFLAPNPFFPPIETGANPLYLLMVLPW